jgi:SagB-type dehydrogenase family enzyme
MTGSKKGIGDRYQQLTSYHREAMAAADYSADPPAEPHKHYPGAAKSVPLHIPPDLPQADFWRCLAGRRSCRDFSSEPLSLDQLALLAFACQGITGRADGYLFRTAPSAGALYPVETYICVNRVAELDAGIYHLNILAWSLELLSPGDHGKELARACLGQDMAAVCGAVFIWTGIPGRSTWKYRERAYRYIYMDAGHIGQNLYLAASALGLGCCGIGAFFDTEVNALIGVDGQAETTVYLGAVGALRSSHSRDNRINP